MMNELPYLIIHTVKSIDSQYNKKLETVINYTVIIIMARRVIPIIAFHGV